MMKRTSQIRNIEAKKEGEVSVVTCTSTPRERVAPISSLPEPADRGNRSVGADGAGCVVGDFVDVKKKPRRS